MTENQSPTPESCKEQALTIPKFREPYDVEENRLCICKAGSGGEHRQELCNFVPILEAVYTYDDGADQKTVYLEWIKKSFLSSDEQIEKFVDALDQSFIRLRSEWQEKMQKEKRIAHARLAENLACLSLGFTMLLRFLKSVGAIGEDESEKYSSEMDELLSDGSIAPPEKPDVSEKETK